MRHPSSAGLFEFLAGWERESREKDSDVLQASFEVA